MVERFVQNEEGPGNRESLAYDEELLRLECLLRNAEFQEIAAAILASRDKELGNMARKRLEEMVAEKPKFGFWTLSDSEYDLEYTLAMELGRLQVFKGNVSADRDQYQLARRLSRSHPNLVGVTIFDYRRQFRVFLSPRALAMRRFALVEMSRQEDTPGNIIF